MIFQTPLPLSDNVPNLGVFFLKASLNAYRKDEILLRAAKNLLIMIILWINPFEVSYRMGETTFILYECLI